MIWVVKGCEFDYLKEVVVLGMWLVKLLVKSRNGQQSQRHGAVPVIQAANGGIFGPLLLLEEFEEAVWI